MGHLGATALGFGPWPLSLLYFHSFMRALAYFVPSATPKVCPVEPDMVPVLKTHMFTEREREVTVSAFTDHVLWWETAGTGAGQGLGAKEG